MTFHYAGKYNGDEHVLPKRELPEGTVAFKEPTEKAFAVLASVGSLLTLIFLLIPVAMVYENMSDKNQMGITMALVLSAFSIVPHELLHAVCFKGDVYMYNNLRSFMLFVVGTESMSKKRYLMMALCPNIVLGLIPYIIGIFFPQLIGLGFSGAICLSMGFGDYINVFNALFQMPANANTFLSGFHSYWYVE